MIPMSTFASRARTLILVFGIAIPATFIVACDNGAATGVSPSVNEQAAVLEIAGGNEQAITVGKSLPEPLQVRVLDVRGKKLSGAEVIWSVLEGDVQLGTDFSVSREDGIASTTAIIGKKAGPITIAASVPESSADSVRFALQALPDAVAGVVVRDGNNQIERPGASLPSPLVAEAQDRFGNPIPGVEISWTTSAGEVNPAATTTDAEGRAKATLKLPNELGEITVTAAVREQEHLPAAKFTVLVADLGIMLAATQSGNGQKGEVGATLEAPYRVYVYDRDPKRSKAPAAGVPVHWIVPEGAGKVSETVTRTDTTGHAQVFHTLGAKVGEHRVGAVVGKDTVWFASTAHGPNGAVYLGLYSGDKQTGSAGAPLANPFVVRVLDSEGVPVNGVEVYWKVLSGPDGAIAGNRSTTDANGLAQMQAVLPTQKGDTLRVLAYMPALPDSILFTAIVTSKQKDARYLEMTGQGHGNGQSGIIGTPVAQPLRVIVLDHDRHPVEGVEVQWRVLSGGGSVGESGNSVAVSYTDANGIAQITRVLGPAFGEQRTEAYVPGLEPERVIFVSYATSENRPATMMIANEDARFKGIRETWLSEPLRVMVVDSVRSPVAGVAISWAVTSGDGVIQTAISTTNEFGIAENIFRVGSTKNNVVTASLPAINATVEFDVVGTGTPVAFEIVSGDNQLESVKDSATVELGVTLSDPLVVRVLDADGEPVKGAPIVWTTVQGGGGVSVDGAEFKQSIEISTDYDGISRVLRMVTQPDEGKTSAVVRGTFLSVMFKNRVNVN